MLESFASIQQLITNEIESGLDPSRIVIGGFSQGATMSLLTGLISSRQLGGVAVLSGRLPLRDKSANYPRLKEVGMPCTWLQPTHLILAACISTRFLYTDFLGSRLIGPDDQPRFGSSVCRLSDLGNRCAHCASRRSAGTNIQNLQHIAFHWIAGSERLGSVVEEGATGMTCFHRIKFGLHKDSRKLY